MNGVSACLDRLDLAGGLFIHYHEHIIELLLVALVFFLSAEFFTLPGHNIIIYPQEGINGLVCNSY